MYSIHEKIIIMNNINIKNINNDKKLILIIFISNEIKLLDFIKPPTYFKFIY